MRVLETPVTNGYGYKWGAYQGDSLAPRCRLSYMPRGQCDACVREGHDWTPAGWHRDARVRRCRRCGVRAWLDGTPCLPARYDPYPRNSDYYAPFIADDPHEAARA